MARAAIDIGTNTCLLLIAKVNENSKQMEEITSISRYPRLGKGVDETKLLLRESMERVVANIQEFNQIIAQHNVERVIVTGTSAGTFRTHL